MSLTLSEKRSSSVGEAFAAAAGARVTVIRALASFEPPSPLAVKTYMVDDCGLTVVVPCAATVPIPEIEMVCAFSVLQVSRAAWPRCRSLGLAARVALGAGAGGGGGAVLAT